MRISVVLVFIWLLSACGQIAVNDGGGARAVSETHAVDSLYREGLQQKQAGEMRAAQASFERALRIEPNNAALWFELAQLASEQGDFGRARELALRAQALASDDASLERKIARLLRHVSD